MKRVAQSILQGVTLILFLGMCWLALWAAS
jgi:hypothetical protein